MSKDEFWALIEAHVTPDDDALEGLEEALAGRPLDEIVAYDGIFRQLYRDSYSWRLWGAAYLINGGCSDDGFDYFRAGLIAMGRAVFEGALRDPDSLAETVDDEVEREDMLYVANRAYERASGGKALPRAAGGYPELGEGWDFDDADEMEKRYPRLAAKFL